MIYKTFHRKLKIEKYETHKKLGWTQVLQKDKQFLLHQWHPLYSSYYKPGYKSCIKDGRDYDCYKRDIFVVICDTDIP